MGILRQVVGLSCKWDHDGCLKQWYGVGGNMRSGLGSAENHQESEDVGAIPGRVYVDQAR